MKTCTKCGILKNFSEFHKYKKSIDGHKHHCKVCVRKYDQVRIDVSRVMPRKINESGQLHCRKCEQYLDKSKFWGTQTYCKECSSLIGHSHNVTRYGITVEQYIDLEKSQNGICAICKDPEMNKKRLSIDHDHSCCPGSKSCGKCIRGLLCSNCNTFLGNAKDNIETLKAAIAYLEK